MASPRQSSQNKLTNLIQRHLRNWRLTWRWKPIAAGGGEGGRVSWVLICPASYLRHCDKTPTRLQVLPTILFRYENTSRRQQRPSQVLTAGMPAKLTRVRLRRHAGGKDQRCFLSRRRYVLICRSSIAGSTRGYVAGTSGAYENQALLGLKLMGMCRWPRNSYPIMVYFVAKYRPHLSHFWENANYAIPT